MCGNPIECGSLDVVVELSCPVCQRALSWEFEGPGKSRRCAVLEVAEGPHLVGQSFIVPIREELVLGSNDGSWLVLPEGEVAADHCTLKLDRHGVATVANLGSPQGTWIDQLRIVEGVLQPGLDLRLGFYRLKMRYADVGGLSAAPTADLGGDVPEAVPLVVMKGVEETTPGEWLVTNRFVIARNALLSFAWLTAVYHFAVLQTTTSLPPIATLAIGVTIALLLVNTWRRVALVAPYWNYAAVGVAGLVAAADLVLVQPVAAVAAVLQGAAVAMMMLKEPKVEHLVGASALGLGSFITLLIVLVPMLSKAIPAAASAPG